MISTTTIMVGLCVVFSWTLPSAIGVPSTSMHRITAFSSATGNPARDRRTNQKFRPTSSIFSSKRASQSSSSSSIREEIRYIAGRRALLLHPAPASSTDKEDQRQYPPLVVLGGMAQSIASWEFHLPHLSKHRSVLIYEALGQGPPPPSEVCSVDGMEVTLERYYDDVSLERQGRDFWEVVGEAFFAPGSYYYEQQQTNANESSRKVVDVASFSFGGRVSMAAASIKPDRIRRLHLTGVGAERDALANVHLASWKEILGESNTNTDNGDMSPMEEELCDPFNHASRCTSRLRAFAWSVILATYSEQFVAAAGPERVKMWVDSVCRYNTEEGLRAILSQTHGQEDGGNDQPDPWTPAAMAQRIQSSDTSYRIVVGSQDKMANPKQALELARILSQKDDIMNKIAEMPKECGVDTYKVMEGCGHAVPMEAMRLWRQDVLDFLNE